MSNLQSFAVLKEKVNKYQLDHKLEDASIAFDWLALETILDLSDDEIEDAITDGAQDCGIDAIYLQGRTVHIFNFKYTEVFENTNDGFPENETAKIINSMDAIFDKRVSQNDVNAALWEKIGEIWEAFEAGSLNFKFYLCSNKQKLGKPGRQRFEKALDKHGRVEFFYLDQEDLVTKLIERKYRKVNGILTFIDKNYFDRSDGSLKGIVATIAASELVSLVTDPDDPKKVNEDAFNENVRVYQPKNRINKCIIETALSDHRHEFWYLNNGITIVCEKCDYTPTLRSPKATLTNLQVVNGGQTTHALFTAYHQEKGKEKLNDVLLLVRICETSGREISEKISETTNSQIPVNTRDLHANDFIQKKLEDEFESLGYFYERKKNMHQDRQADVRLDNELLGQIYLAYYLSKPSEAKNSKSLVFGDEYDNIFDEDTVTAVKMLLPYQIYLPINEMKKEIQTRKRKRSPISERDAFVSRATFHLLYAVRLISDAKELDLGDAAERADAIETAIKYVGEVVVRERAKRKGLYTHDKFFKETPTDKLIRDHVQTKFADSAGASKLETGD